MSEQRVARLDELEDGHPVLVEVEGIKVALARARTHVGARCSACWEDGLPACNSARAGPGARTRAYVRARGGLRLRPAPARAYTKDAKASRGRRGHRRVRRIRSDV